MTVPYRDEGSGTATGVTGIAAHAIATYDIDLSGAKAGIVRADVNGINATSGEALNVTVFIGYKVFGGTLTVNSSVPTVNFSDYAGISVNASVSGSSIVISVTMTIAGQMLDDVDVNFYVSATEP